VASELTMAHLEALGRDPDDLNGAALVEISGAAIFFVYWLRRPAVRTLAGRRAVSGARNSADLPHVFTKRTEYLLSDITDRAKSRSLLTTGATMSCAHRPRKLCPLFSVELIQHVA
jgi:hypothetical protein